MLSILSRRTYREEAVYVIPFELESTTENAIKSLVL